MAIGIAVAEIVAAIAAERINARIGFLLISTS